jgi:hypothetical protein
VYDGGVFQPWPSKEIRRIPGGSLKSYQGIHKAEGLQVELMSWEGEEQRRWLIDKGL